MPSKEELQMLQALPLEIKVMKTQQRIREWVQYYGENGVVVSFSGGKDSTVLLHLVRKLYPNVRAVFSDTGLEYPEIREFVKSVPNVDWVKPKQTFREVAIKHGYPLFSKEVAETIRYARKIGGGYKSSQHFRYRAFGFEGGGTNHSKKLYIKGHRCWANELQEKETTRGF